MTRKQSYCCSGVAPHLEYTVLLQRCCARSGISWFSSRFFMILESPSLSGLRSQTHFSDFIKFFSQFSSIWPFLKFDYPVLRMTSRRSMRLSSWMQQYSLCIYWPVPSLVAAEAVLLHIWNLPTEMTRKQSCCSERWCSRSKIHSSPVATVLVQIWHMLNFRQYSSWFSSPPVSGLRSHFWDFTVKIFFSILSSIWPFLKFDYTVLRMISRPPERLSTTVVY